MLAREVHITVTNVSSHRIAKLILIIENEFLYLPMSL